MSINPRLASPRIFRPTHLTLATFALRMVMLLLASSVAARAAGLVRVIPAMAAGISDRLRTLEEFVEQPS